MNVEKGSACSVCVWFWPIVVGELVLSLCSKRWVSSGEFYHCFSLTAPDRFLWLEVASKNSITLVLRFCWLALLTCPEICHGVCLLFSCTNFIEHNIRSMVSWTIEDRISTVNGQEMLVFSERTTQWDLIFKYSSMQGPSTDEGDVDRWQIRGSMSEHDSLESKL